MSTFRFIGFGERAPASAASCDGLVEGADLHLSHWAGNRTPRELKADTSTEIALRHAGAGGAGLIVNNHFDTDGALSVWALLEPEAALAHAPLLVAAAEAGDFEEWPADPRGLWLDAAVTALAGGAEDDEAYARVLPQLAEVVANLERRRDLWAPAWDALQAADDAARRVRISRHGAVAVFHHPPGMAELPGVVLSRHAPAPASGVRRWLVALEDEAGFRYRYERPRWAWADTVVRPVIPSPDRDAIARALGPAWTAKASGMTAIAATRDPIPAAPDAILAALAAVDG